MAVPSIAAHNVATATSGTSLNITLTAPQNSVILLCSDTTNGTVANTISSISGGGLSFVPRWSFQVTQPNAFNGTTFISNECRWAGTTVPQNNTTFTVNYSGTILSAIVLIFAVTGVGNLLTPFDPHPSLPSVTSNINASSLNAQTVLSTQLSNSLVFGFGANYTNPILQGASSSPWGNIQSPSGNGTSLGSPQWNSEADQFQTFVPVQSNLTVGSWSAGGIVAAWTFVADALTASTIPVLSGDSQHIIRPTIGRSYL